MWQSLATLRDRHPEARWTTPEQYHATLVFLGSTDADRVEGLATALRGATHGWQAFTARLGEGGGRPGGRRGGVAWLRLAVGRDELSRLSLTVDEALGTGAYVDIRPRPHVTVARRVDRALLDDLAATSAGLRVEWRADRVVLYRSHTFPAGARYEELASAELAPAAGPRLAHR